MRINVFKDTENLVFQGGGVKGIAYLGALKEATNSENENHFKLSQIKRVGGASAGAITAFLIAIGKSMTEIEDILGKLNFSDLLDDGDRLKNFTTKQVVLKFNEILNSNESKKLDYFIYIFCEACCALSKENLPVLALDTIKRDIISKHRIIGSLLNGIMEYFDDSLKGMFEKGIEEIKDFILDRLSEMNLDQVQAEILSFFTNSKRMEDFIYSLSMIAKNFYNGDCRGIFKGDVFLNWIRKQLEDSKLNPNITFSEFKKELSERHELKELYIVVLNLSSGIVDLFSHKHRSTQDVLICDAVRASMSIPYFFEPRQIRYKSGATIQKKNDLYVDGGVLENYPIWVFDNLEYIQPAGFFYTPNRKEFNHRTLGFRLINTKQKEFFEEQKQFNPNVHFDAKIMEYTAALVSTVFNKQESDHYHSGNTTRTVYIDTLDVNFVDFGIDASKKKSLIASGEKGVRDYIARQWPNFYEEAVFSAANTIGNSVKIGVSTIPFALGISASLYSCIPFGSAFSSVLCANTIATGITRSAANMVTDLRPDSELVKDRKLDNILAIEKRKIPIYLGISGLVNFGALLLVNGKEITKEKLMVSLGLTMLLAFNNYVIHQQTIDDLSDDMKSFRSKYLEKN